MPIAEQIVVGVAVLRHGEVLIARRSYPPALAGQWELPGGKVDRGESVAEAAVREIAEELAISVRVVGEFAESVLVKPGLRLVAAWASLDDGGAPQAREHDALRWIGPEDVDDVDWVAADRVFLPALRDRLLAGEPLAGGHVGGAVRIGSTVRRPTGPWTPAVHELLAHLHELPATPTVLGVDERDREVLTYLPGETVDPDTTPLSDRQVASCAARLREIHDRLANYRPAGSRVWRYGERALQPGESICHNDPGVYNWAFDGDDAVGLFDWDMAGPGVPLDDVAFLAWTAIPLFRPTPDDDVVRRLRLLAEAYGDAEIDAATALEAAHRRMTLAGQRIAAGIARGDAGFAQLAALGEPARTQARVDALTARLPALLSELAPG